MVIGYGMIITLLPMIYLIGIDTRQRCVCLYYPPKINSSTSEEMLIIPFYANYFPFMYNVLCFMRALEVVFVEDLMIKTFLTHNFLKHF